MVSARMTSTTQRWLSVRPSCAIAPDSRVRAASPRPSPDGRKRLLVGSCGQGGGGPVERQTECLRRRGGVRAGVRPRPAGAREEPALFVFFTFLLGRPSCSIRGPLPFFLLGHLTSSFQISPPAALPEDGRDDELGRGSGSGLGWQRHTHVQVSHPGCARATLHNTCAATSAEMCRSPHHPTHIISQAETTKLSQPRYCARHPVPPTAHISADRRPLQATLNPGVL